MKPKLNVYSTSFHGHYINGESVIVAESIKDAVDMINTELKSMNLSVPNRRLVVETDIVLVDIKKAGVHILCDGDY